MSTQTVIIPVPSSGGGSSVDVSALVGEKTVILSGRYQGAYVLYGSHDGSHFAPLLIFNAGGIESIRQTFSGALSQVRLKSLASNVNGVSASISGLSVSSDNSFASIGPVGKGLSGVVDLGDSAYQTDLNFMGFGRLNGVVVVEGSSDGVGFNPIGEFSAGPSGSSLLGGGGIEFSPLGTADKVRYVRLNVLGDVDSFLVTIGGAQSESGGGGGETLAEAYLAGVMSVDQTMNLTDSNGGKIVIDASGAGFTGQEAVDILGPAYWGGLCVGPQNLGIGTAASPPYFISGQFNVAIGPYITVVAGDSSVLLGEATQSWGDVGVSIGYAAQNGLGSVSIGNLSRALPIGAVAMGLGAQANAAGTVAIGWGSQANGDYSIAAGYLSHANYDGDVVIGSDSSTSESSSMSPGNNVVIGSGSSAVDESNVVIGDSCGMTGPYSDHLVVIGSDNAVTSLETSVMIGQSITVVSSGEADNIIVGHQITVGDQTGLLVCIGQYIDLPEAANGIVIGTAAGLGISTFGIAIGAGSNVTCVKSPPRCGIALGDYAAAADNEFIVGAGSNVIIPDPSMHTFAVRGYKGGNIDTIRAIDNPVSDGLVGLFVTVNRSGTVTSRQVYIGADDSGGSGYALLRVPN